MLAIWLDQIKELVPTQAGALENTPENLAAWLHDPDDFKPGSNMPNFKLSDGDVRALVAFLETQK